MYEMNCTLDKHVVKEEHVVIITDYSIPVVHHRDVNLIII